MTICCIRKAGDSEFDLDRRAAALGIDYCEVVERSRFDPKTMPALRAILRQRRPMIVHSHQYKASYFAWRLARAEGAVPMATCHGWTGHSWRKRLVYYPADKLIVRRFAMCIAVSSQIGDTLVRWGCRPERVRVILNGIEAQDYRRDDQVRAEVRDELGVGPEEIVVGAVGRVERQKRFDVLLEAVARFRSKRPNLRAFVVGDGSLRGEIERRAKRLGLGEYCQLLGHRSDMGRVYQAFDIVVQSSDYEGTPTVVVEAMAVGIPVVATDVGGTAELAYDGVHALLVPRSHPEALAEAIERTLSDPEATACRVAAARRRVETELSFDRRTRKLEEAYRDLLESQSDARSTPASRA